MYGGINFGIDGESSGDDLFQSQDRLRYPDILDSSSQRVASVPISMGLSRFHFLLLYKNFLQVLENVILYI